MTEIKLANFEQMLQYRDYPSTPLPPELRQSFISQLDRYLNRPDTSTINDFPDRTYPYVRFACAISSDYAQHVLLFAGGKKDNVLEKTPKLLYIRLLDSSTMEAASVSFRRGSTITTADGFDTRSNLSNTILRELLSTRTLELDIQGKPGNFEENFIPFLQTVTRVLQDGNIDAQLEIMISKRYS